MGDLGNLLGAQFTHQARWQVAIGGYYVFVDLCLVGQWVWYEWLRHGHAVVVLRNWRAGSRRGGGGDGDSGEVSVIEGMIVASDDDRDGGEEADEDGCKGQDTTVKPAPQTRPKIIFRTPTFQREQSEKEKASFSSTGTPRSLQVNRVGPSSPMPSPSPRTMLFLACLIAMANAAPTSRTAASDGTFETSATSLENAGTVLSWMSTVLYLGSRIPQLFKNYRRKSTAGLSPHLFIAAFCGNLFYSSALLTNPNAWYDFDPYGGGGWAGKEGSDRVQWVLAALPFFLGAAGVLGLDASMGVQFLMYGEKNERLVVLEEEGARGKWHWRRVSGWMRGWVPSVSGESQSVKVAERGRLLDERSGREEGYGGL